MRSTNEFIGGVAKRKGTMSGWIRLVVGLGLMWSLAYVVLPWGQTLPHIRPIMEAIVESNVDSGTYWYTQSEETAVAQVYVHNAVRNR
jgi:hypothetical protein